MNGRQRSMIHIFIEKRDFITAKELANRFTVSTKTIYSDVDKINEMLKREHLEIKKVPRRGMILNLTSNEIARLTEILNSGEKENDTLTVIDREKELIKRLFLMNQELDLFDYADNVYISEVSAKRDLDKLEKKLKSYSIGLTKKTTKIRVNGSEKLQRKFIREYVISKLVVDDDSNTQFFESFFHINDLDKIKNVIIQLAQSYQYQLSNQYFYLLLIDILIQQNRMEQQLLIEVDNDVLLVDIHHLEVYLFALELMEKLFDYKIDEIPATEAEALSYSLLAIGFKINSPNYNERLEKEVDRLIQKVSRILNLDLTKDEYLKMMLLNHIGPMIFRLKNTTCLENPILEEIKKQYSALYNVIWLTSNDLLNEFGISLTDAEAAFLTIHFQIAVEKIRRPMNILVICPHGLATSELIMSKITRIFANTDNVIKVDLPTLKNKKLDNVDFVISSVKVPKLSIPCINVSPLITDSEMQEIMKCYSELSSIKNLSINNSYQKKELDLRIISELIGEKILLKQKIGNETQALDHMLKMIDIENIKNIEFCQSVYEREKMGSTSVYTGVALPHCDPKFVKRSEIICMTVDKPIMWGKNLIKVVFLIAIAEKDIDILKNSLVKLYSKIEDSQFIEDLWKAKTETEFHQSLSVRSE